MLPPAEREASRRPRMVRAFTSRAGRSAPCKRGRWPENHGANASRRKSRMPSCTGAVHLRRATEADAAAMARIQVCASRVAYRRLLPDELLAAMTEAGRERAWRREILLLP